MSNIKKDFVAVFELLEANQNSKVKTILPQLIELMSKKTSGGSDIGKTYLLDDNKDVVAVYCYYHKKWELVDQVAYGKKANTKTGLNTMCKEGYSNWTKQQRQASKAKEALLERVADGEVLDTQVELAEIELARTTIHDREDGHGYEFASDINL